ncbi:hypothetical protein ACEWY4_000136 [Coilia grayii]|uniref:H15 domain-containing protein n=1 Tax=Coilia grayii TaxID=363190 RepID=A0ABD1KVT0_9TELE
MGPKKATAVDDQTVEPAKEKLAKATKKATADDQVVPKKHPSTMAMLQEALKALDNRKGVSAQAVRTYITQKYSTVDPVRLKPMVRRALAKGLETGAVVRAANSTTAAGAQGKFRPAKKEKEKPPVKKENADPNKPKAPKGRKAMGKGPEVSKGDKKVKVASEDDAEVSAAKKKPAAKKQPAAKDQDSSDAKPKKSGKEGSAASSKVVPAKKPKGGKAKGSPEEGTTSKAKSARATKAAAADADAEEEPGSEEEHEPKSEEEAEAKADAKPSKAKTAAPKKTAKAQKSAEDGDTKAKKSAEDGEGKAKKDGEGKAKKDGEGKADGAKGKRKRAAE